MVIIPDTIAAMGGYTIAPVGGVVSTKIFSSLSTKTLIGPRVI